jgi:hypothetical protein
MYKICFYVPENAVEIVKQAMFSAGAGRIGNYDSCCWQVLGTGQFKPLENSNPAIGETGKVETVSEYKVEMVCEEKIVKDVIEALRQSHPYEEPAYDVLRLEDF